MENADKLYESLFCVRNTDNPIDKLTDKLTKAQQRIYELENTGCDCDDCEDMAELGRYRDSLLDIKKILKVLGIEILDIDNGDEIGEKIKAYLKENEFNDSFLFELIKTCLKATQDFAD